MHGGLLRLRERFCRVRQRLHLKERCKNLVWKAGRLPFIKLFSFFFVEILGGYKVYRKLRRQYGNDILLLICPHTGTGDMYNIGLYFQAYLKANGIEHYTFLFRGRSEQKVGRLFGIQGDSILSDRDNMRLMRFAHFIQPRDIGLRQLHHYPFPSVQNGRLENFEEYKNIAFTHLFRDVAMGLGPDADPVCPHFSDTPKAAEFFAKNGLKPGKTVILAPYSTSAQIIPMKVWEDLAKRLEELGYTVATNCVPKKERPVAGTIELGFEYQYAKAYLELAGYFVGARSGLCDVVSSTNCKKIVLSPYWSPNLSWLGSAGKSMRFYGLCHNYGRDDTVEIEYDFDSVSMISAEVVHRLQQTKFEAGEVVLRQDLSPRFDNKTAIVLSFNEFFAPYASVTLQSIVEFSSPNSTYDIILLNDGMDIRTKNMLLTPFAGRKNFSVRFVDCRAFFAGKQLHVERGYAPVIYYRLSLPTILSAFEKIIYLDSDIIMNSDVALLYSYELGDNLIAGVRDLPMIAWGSIRSNPEHENIYDKLKLSDPMAYINSGMLICNVAKFNEELPFASIIDYVTSHQLRWMDQDVFNKLCDGKILLLPQEFNVITSARDDAEIIRSSKCPELIFDHRTAMENPKIIHFIGCSFLYIDNPTYWCQNYWRLARKTPYYELLQMRANIRVRG